MIRLKEGVNLGGVVPQIVLALVTINELFRDQGLDCWITSCNDGRHSRKSLHWDSRAVDIRSKELGQTHKKEALVEDFSDALGPDLDFILEGLGTPNEHFHLEWQPKAR